MNCYLIKSDRCDLVTVTGPDSAKFLQGQLSCDVEELNSNESRTGCYCNLKGRVISDFRIVRVEDGFVMQLTSGMGTVLKEALARYIVFFKAEISVHNDKFRQLRISGEDASNFVTELFGECPRRAGEIVQKGPNRVTSIDEQGSRFEFWLSPDEETMLENIQRHCTEADDTSWRLADIAHGVLHIQPSMQEQYTPQLLNYDLSGVINFDKGCYTGQEIIARMYYRGTAKKRLFRASVKIDSASVDSTVDAMEGTAPVGDILAISSSGKGEYEMLLILPTYEKSAQPTLLINNHQDSALKILSLSYT